MDRNLCNLPCSPERRPSDDGLAGAHWTDRTTISPTRGSGARVPNLWPLSIFYFMYPRKKGDADVIRKCDEFAPADVMKALHLKEEVISKDELSRAEWFWNRRPNVLCDKWTFVSCFVIGFFCFLYFVPTNVPACLVWIVAGLSFAGVESVRLTRWQMEYKASIKRVIVYVPER